MQNNPQIVIASFRTILASGCYYLAASPMDREHEVPTIGEVMQ